MILGDVCTRSCGFCSVKTGRGGFIDQKEPLNVSSVGENIFYHGIHFLRGRGWTEESLLEAVRNHYHMYDIEVDESDSEPDPQSTENDKK